MLLTNCTNCDIQSKLCIQKIYANYGKNQKYGVGILSMKKQKFVQVSNSFENVTDEKRY